jgi:hypothetical protein
MNNNNEIVDNEQSSAYIVEMQKEGLFDGMLKTPPQYPDCKIYMEAYLQAK